MLLLLLLVILLQSFGIFGLANDRGGWLPILAVVVASSSSRSPAASTVFGPSAPSAGAQGALAVKPSRPCGELSATATNAATAWRRIITMFAA